MLDANQKLYDYVHLAAAIELLSDGKATVFRQAPFTIILKEVSVDESK